MSDIAIKVENLSKLYQLGEVGTGTLSKDLNRWWAKMRGKEDPYAKVGQVNDRTKKVESDFVWALRDINFEVKQGEVLGIIGKNGAGKSTLLKILSKITSPTTGKIYTKGRIASLLEVGTGFHPEMTGRENIYLNGAILGMKKWEIDKKFDEIVDFSGVEGYIDTPVKRYSSGMYVRLAFAVAAYLDPEILIIDEVLAVGDAEFQKKCLGRMKEVSINDGRTVLFVSHNMQAISTLTQKSLFIERGLLNSYTETKQAIKKYLECNTSGSPIYDFYPQDFLVAYISNIRIETSLSNNIHTLKAPLSIQIIVTCNESIKNAAISFQIINSLGQSVIHVLNISSEQSFCTEPGKFKLKAFFPEIRLYPDNYSLTVHFADNFSKTKFQTIENVCPFEVKLFGEVRDYYWYKNHATYVEDSVWEISKIL